MKEYILRQLAALEAIDSPSGFHREIQAYLVKTLQEMGYTPECLRKGGVRVKLGGTGAPISLLAHCDTLGAVVAHAKGNGRLAISNISLNANNIETETVRVHTRDGRVYDGTIQLSNASVHVNDDVNVARSFKNLEVVLDEDVHSAEDVENLGILPGDFIAVDPRFKVTDSGYIKSRFLDDKASAAVLLGLAKYISESGVALSREVWLGFTVFEEIGHGATCGIPEQVEEIISVDMGCVGDDLKCTEKMVSICSKDSGGPYHYDVVNALIEAAKKCGADYAVDIYPLYGSDAEAALQAGYDVRHGLIGPGVYASHGYERTHIDGLLNTLMLLRTYLNV